MIRWWCLAAVLVPLGCADIGQSFVLEDASSSDGADVLDDLGSDVGGFDDTWEPDAALDDLGGGDGEEPIDVPMDSSAPDLPDLTDEGGDAGEDVGDDAEEVADGDLSDALEDTAPEVSDAAADVAPDGDVADADTVSGPCDDDDPCTDDIELTDGGCSNPWILGKCCLANPMCDDGDPCTTDSCVPNPDDDTYGLCLHDAACCSTDADCDDGNGCTVTSCAGGICVATPTGDEGCCLEQLLLNSFDEKTLGGVTVSNVHDEVGWHLSEGVEANSGLGSLWYGDPLVESYDNGLANAGIVYLPAVTLPAGVRTLFSFDIWADVEPGLNYDVLEWELQDLDTGETLIIWNKQELYGYATWLNYALNLSAFAGRHVRLVMSFDTVNEQSNDGKGVFLDNLQIVSTCMPTTCTSPGQCDDGLGATLDSCAIAAGETEGICAYTPSSLYCVGSYECFDAEPCTSDVCSGNQCVYPTKSNCCLSDSECDDGNPCTANDCIGASASDGGFCNFVSLPGCCIVDSQCNDGNPCTTDSCPEQGGQCSNVPIEGCCQVNGDCDDGEPCTEDLCNAGTCTATNLCCGSDDACDDGDPLCTVDTCVDGVCQFSYEPQGGCCTTTPLLATYSGGGWDGFSVYQDSDPTDGIGWFAVPNKGHSPGGALHFGDLGDGTYDTGNPVDATAVSPVVSVPASSVVLLSFWIYLDNEYANGLGSLQWDRVRVSVLDIDEETTQVVWDSAAAEPQWWAGAPDAPMGPKWTEVSGLDLSDFKGRKIRLLISFDSVDADANAFEGVYVDDIVLLATCPVQ